MIYWFKEYILKFKNIIKAVTKQNLINFIRKNFYTNFLFSKKMYFVFLFLIV